MIYLGKIMFVWKRVYPKFCQRQMALLRVEHDPEPWSECRDDCDPQQPERNWMKIYAIKFSPWLTDNTRAQSYKEILVQISLPDWGPGDGYSVTLICYPEIKYSDWLKLFLWLATSIVVWVIVVLPEVISNHIIAIRKVQVPFNSCPVSTSRSH